MTYPRRRGGGLMLLAGLITLAIATYFYLVPGFNLDGEMGVQFVIFGAAMMVFGALVVMFFRGGFVATLFLFLLLLDIIGTTVCAYFLESILLMAAMALAAVGWIIRVGSRGVVTL
jgi:hypothetical protein